MAKHDADNVEQLALDIVNDWDFDTLFNYALTNLKNHYMNDEEDFHKEWEDFYE